MLLTLNRSHIGVISKYINKRTVYDFSKALPSRLINNRIHFPWALVLKKVPTVSFNPNISRLIPILMGMNRIDDSGARK